MKLSPRKHQKEGISAILEEFKTADRCLTPWPCGAGKTYLSGFLSLSLEPQFQTILYLVPSITLLWQSSRSWRKLPKWKDSNLLRLCSSNGREEGDQDTTGCTTSPEDVKKFFDTLDKSKPTVVFSTYQSSRLLAGRGFDLGVFDEAQKTAGRVGSAFTFALEEKNIHISKRLFQTATPTERGMTEKGGVTIAYSMTDPSVYGRIAGKMTHPEAVKRGLICDYKIVVAIVTDKDVATILHNKTSITEVNGKQSPARNGAMLIALRKAWEKYHFKKVFSFHNLIEDARVFADQSHSQCIFKEVLPEFDTFHVNGEFPQKAREVILDAFKNTSKPALTSSADCLGTGIDLPLADAVFFGNRKKSIGSTVQCAGRCTRLAPGKKFGYVILPVFLSTKDITTPEGIVRSDIPAMELAGHYDMRAAWEVLENLRSEDKVLWDHIGEITAKGKKANRQERERLKDFVDVIGLPVGIEYEELQRSIAVRLARGIDFSWHEKFLALKNYLIKSRGKYPRKDTPIGSFVHRIRAGQLAMTPSREADIKSINFIWDSRQEFWNRSFSELKDYLIKNGGSYPSIRTPLGRFIAAIRYGNIRITPSREADLKSISFIRDSRQESWNRGFSELKDYLIKSGGKYPHRHTPIGRFIAAIRSGHMRMTPSREADLKSISFIRDSRQESWNRKFSELKDYLIKSGGKYPPNHTPLGNFVDWIRGSRFKVTPSTKKDLNSIGFVWGSRK